MRLLTLIGSAAALLGALLFFIVAILSFSGVDSFDEAKVVSGLQGLAYTSFFAGIGLFMYDRAEM